jgi:hypothetical protein
MAAIEGVAGYTNDVLQPALDAGCVTSGQDRARFDRHAPACLRATEKGSAALRAAGWDEFASRLAARMRPEDLSEPTGQQPAARG